MLNKSLALLRRRRWHGGVTRLRRVVSHALHSVRHKHLGSDHDRGDYRRDRYADIKRLYGVRPVYLLATDIGSSGGTFLSSCT